MKKALIINEGYSDNLGDQAIKKAMISFFVDNNFEPHFLHFSKPYLKKLPQYDYIKFTEKSSLKPSTLKGFLYPLYWVYVNKGAIVSKLKSNNFDVVVFGGGQLINSSGKVFPSAFASSLFWLTFFVRRYTKAKIYLVSVGCAAIFGKIEHFLYKRAIKKIDNILVRDYFSKKAMLKVFKRKAEVIPDIAFYSSPNSQILKNEKQGFAIIGVTNFKEVFLKYNKGSTITKEEYYEQYFTKILEYQAGGLDTMLFYTTISDALESRNFQQYLLKKHNFKIEIFKSNTIEDLIVKLKKANKVLSARMHALILGMKYNCSVEPYLISEKLKSFNTDYIQQNNAINNLSNEIENKLKIIFNED